jgi:DNA-binding Xre family transcriptional regulator
VFSEEVECTQVFVAQRCHCMPVRLAARISDRHSMKESVEAPRKLSQVREKLLRDRARQLELSDAEVARRAGLAERRYSHYVRGTRQPDFKTLLRICSALDTTPNDLLLADASPKRS